MISDPIYWAIFGIGIVLSLVTAGKVKSTFAHYSQIRSRSGLSGAQVAMA
ncbi:MAG TPA: zinc metallopeptidase, partial [Planctomycetota bacterium]|nr:zinc metallopeptidase [Planctomycetota bacterium]